MALVPLFLLLSFHNSIVTSDSELLETTLLRLYLVSTGGWGRIAYLLNQHRLTLCVHSRGCTPFVPLCSETMKMGFAETTNKISALLDRIFTTSIYSSYSGIFHLCHCFGERERANPMLISKAKLILTRTNAFYIPVQLKTNLVFMMFFFTQHSCGVFHLQSGKHRNKGPEEYNPSTSYEKQIQFS